MSNAELLRAARAKIERPERWAQGYFAYRRVMGVLVKTGVHDANACSWCVRGAVAAVGGTVTTAEYLVGALTEVAKPANHMHIDLPHVARYNDAPVRRHPDILNLLDVAIRLAEADEAAAEHVIH